MKRTAIFFILLTSVISGTYWYGNSLPDINHSSSSHQFNRPAEYIWKLIFDFKQYPDWRVNVYSVEEIRNTSKYAEWKEINEDGITAPYKLLTFEQNKFITIKEAGDKRHNSNTLHFEVKASKDGKSSTLTITEDKYMPDLSPRIINHLLGTSSSHIDSYFRSIENKILRDARLAKKNETLLPLKTQVRTSK